MVISNLYKVGDKTVFYSNDLGQYRQAYYEGLMNGTLTGYSSSGEVMEAADAAEGFLLMCDFYPMGCNLLEQIYRNMLVSTIIIAVVKAELMYEEDGEGCILALSTIIGALQTGSLGTAAELCLAITPTTALTTERLTRWADMCNTADSIVLEETV